MGEHDFGASESRNWAQILSLSFMTKCVSVWPILWYLLFAEVYIILYIEIGINRFDVSMAEVFGYLWCTTNGVWDDCSAFRVVYLFRFFSFRVIKNSFVAWWFAELWLNFSDKEMRDNEMADGGKKYHTFVCRITWDLFVFGVEWVKYRRVGGGPVD